MAKEMTIRVGVSSCLLGQEVRYNGGHARNSYVVETLADHFELLPVCPEEEVGMGTPRETVNLQGDAEAPLMIAPKSGEDWTTRMNRYSASRCRELALEELRGYVFKSKSPSCGVWRVKLYKGKGPAGRTTRGLFAAEFVKRFPLVPVEEEGRLRDAGLRENFLERVFAYDRLCRLFAGRWKRGDVVAFHSREKYLLMAHSPRHYKDLGRLVAAIAEHTPAAFRDRYQALFMEALTVKATTRRHVNALLHVAGHLKGIAGAPERQRVLDVIEEYGRGLVPLIVPMTLLNHYIEVNEVPYVQDQTYLNPHPRELMLRNHV
jgi:uncharacterized protein YbgA (DUF1722 family)/uncharacterized protein YbbK (DUF523 family)